MKPLYFSWPQKNIKSIKFFFPEKKRQEFSTNDLKNFKGNFQFHIESFRSLQKPLLVSLNFGPAKKKFEKISQNFEIFSNIFLPKNGLEYICFMGY